MRWAQLIATIINFAGRSLRDGHKVKPEDYLIGKEPKPNPDDESTPMVLRMLKKK